MREAKLPHGCRHLKSWHTLRIWVVTALAVALPLAAYFPLKSANPNYYQFFDATRCAAWFHAVAAWLLMAASVMAAGGLLRRTALRWGAWPPRAACDHFYDACLRVGLGLGAHMMALFVLAVLKLLDVKFILPLNLIVLLAGAGELKRQWQAFRRHYARHELQTTTHSRLPRFAAILIAAGATAALIPLALMLGAPVAEWDEMVYQLTIPQHMLAAKGFVRQPYLFFFDWPLNMNLIFAESMALGTHVTARFWHFSLGLMTAALAGRLACRWAGQAVAGWLAAAIFLTIPIVQLELGVAMVDLSLAFFILLAFSIWDGAITTGQNPAGADTVPFPAWRQGALAGVFLGLSAGVKYMGLYALLALLAVMVLDLIRPRSRRAWGIGAIATVALGAIVLFSPWAVKNWIFTGNPLYPQFYGLFGGADWSEEFARQWREWIFHLGPGRSLLDFLLLPWRLTFHSSPFYADFAGDLSPILFPAVIVALLMPSLWPRLRPALLVSLIYLVLWFLSSQQMRFLIPCFALLAAAGGAGMARALESKSRNGLWGGVLAAVIFATAWFLHPTPLSIADANFTVTFGRPHAMDHDGYLYHRRGVDNIYAIRRLNELMDGRGAALLFFDNRGYYLERPYLADGAFEVSRLVSRLMATPDTVSFARWLRSQGVTHILWNQNFSDSDSGQIVFRYYPEYLNKWKNFIADHAKVLYEMNGIILLELNAEAPPTAGATGEARAHGL